MIYNYLMIKQVMKKHRRKFSCQTPFCLRGSISLTASREFSATEFIFMAHMTEPHREGLRIAPKTGIIGEKDKRTDCQKTAKPKVSEGRKE